MPTHFWTTRDFRGGSISHILEVGNVFPVTCCRGQMPFDCGMCVPLLSDAPHCVTTPHPKLRKHCQNRCCRHGKETKQQSYYRHDMSEDLARGVGNTEFSDVCGTHHSINTDGTACRNYGLTNTAATKTSTTFTITTGTTTATPSTSSTTTTTTTTRTTPKTVTLSPPETWHRRRRWGSGVHGSNGRGNASNGRLPA